MTAATATPVPAAVEIVESARPRRVARLLLPVATLLAASTVAIASGATFSSSTASTGLVASGTLTQVNSNTVAFAKSNLKPGDTVAGSVTITNSGSLPARFTLTESTVSNTFVPAGDVTLAIAQNGAPLSSATLGAAGAIDLGTFAAGEARTYSYTVTFSSAAGNAQQGKSAETRYAFTSVQTDADSFTGTQGGTSQTSPS